MKPPLKDDAMPQDRYPSAIRPPNTEHITIYYDRKSFAGWPFNHGFKAFSDDELLVSFSRGPCNYASRYDMGHHVVDARGGEYVTMRSTDGGMTWSPDSLRSLGTRQDIERPLYMKPEAAPAEPYDWRSPDFFLTAGFGIPPDRDQDIGYIQYTRDRGRTWEGPYRMPAFDFAWVQVKPDYILRPDGVVLLFVTVGIGDSAARNRIVAVYASSDAGLSWNYLSSIIAESPDRRFVKRYYASPVLLEDGRILAAMRCQVTARAAWPEVFESGDGGRSWRFVSRVNDWGGPTELMLLADGRLLAVYGYRVPPYGIRARLSEDDGATWGPELILRDDGGSWDLGYPRTALLADGKVIVAYYFNRADDEIQLDGGVRHIAATVFTP